MTIIEPGDIYQSKTDGSIWRVTLVCSSPTMTLEHLTGVNEAEQSPRSRSGAIGCLLFEDLHKIASDPSRQE